MGSFRTADTVGFRVQGLSLRVLQRFIGLEFNWEIPKIGDPNIVPLMVFSLL